MKRKNFVGKSTYITRGISSEVPGELVNYLWVLIKNKAVEGVELDYLQVFELKCESTEEEKAARDFKIKITHKQEVEEFEDNHIVIVGKNVEGKIFAIDDGKYATMLWAREY